MKTRDHVMRRKARRLAILEATPNRSADQEKRRRELRADLLAPGALERTVARVRARYSERGA